ncbi:phosphate signaling complex protein PhoU [Canibacter sp. lx-72]|uniref:phosphate signaling complex protein PhoU n=1 Tax=Canibacter zhuwentaonis TaxID=2837491 RepID=UPI001BDD4F7F|nr:phosphate signaling complex protein PhoU [Canibacter zhuwentaonis]MBT1017734.1 phosphate signaling complex protein PhoU [Canibacter zhuwentaonis]
MRVVFQQELREIQDGLAEIAELVMVAIDNAATAFASSDLTLAETVIQQDPLVDRLVLQLDERVTDVLARQQPVASDLRLMVSSLRMSASLERMADLAQHIAQLVRMRYPDAVVPQSLQPIFMRMGQLDIEMAQNIVHLLREQDLGTCFKIRDLDDELDELHAEVFAKVLSATQQQKPEHVIDVTLASRYHERFGDHAVSISKQMTYFLAGNR